jgi:hypothetical protein
MRLLTIAGAAVLLLLPAATLATACEGDAYIAEAASPVFASAQVTATELSADEMKKGEKKPMKKTAKKPKMPKEKVEYMRAVPTGPTAK